MQGASTQIVALLAIAFVVIVALVDLRTCRIPNVLCGIAALVGLIAQLVANGAAGILVSVGGLAVALVMFLPFYAVRAFGAGDVKAMAAAGVYLGAKWTLLAGGITLAAGAVLGALVLFLSASTARTALHRLVDVAASPLVFAKGTIDPITAKGRQRFPYGVAIAVGVTAATLSSGLLIH